jgi:hypothetical protein
VATLAQKIKAETMVREMIAENGLPEPDDIEYGFTCIRVLWSDPKVALVVDIDPPLEDLLTPSAED